MTGAEAIKMQQDFFVDKLIQQARQLEETCALYEVQLTSQHNESQAAHETLQDATCEMEAIGFEKKQLLNQWKMSLSSLEKRDQMLHGIVEAARVKKDTILVMNAELNGFRIAQRRLQDQNEMVNSVKEKLEKEVDNVRRQLQYLADTKEKHKESYSIVSKSLVKLEQDLAAVTQERNLLSTALNRLRKSIHTTTTTTLNLEMESMKLLQDQSGITKQGEGVVKDGVKLKRLLHEKQSELVVTENEIMRVKLERIMVEERLGGVRQHLDQLELRVVEQNRLVERCELEIRRQSQEISKKQSEMDLLNRKYDALVAQQMASGAVNSEVGPLEATIYNLGRVVGENELVCSKLQIDWLKCQTDLVVMVKRTEEVALDYNDALIKKSILERKNAHLNAQMDRELQNIKLIERDIRKLQTEMTKINSLLSKHSIVQSQLEEHNLGLELEFRSRLKTSELESLQLEQRIESVKEEKERAMNGLVDAEFESHLKFILSISGVRLCCGSKRSTWPVRHKLHSIPTSVRQMFA